MKKMIASLLSVAMLTTTVFGIQPTVARAETLPQEKQTEYKLLSQKELLPYIDYENAVEHGHVARVYSEEDLNTIVYRNMDGTKTAYIFDYDVKYVAEDGTIEDKDIDLIEIDGGYNVKKSDISLTIPESIMSGLEFEHDDGYIKLTPVRETLFEEALSKASAAQNAPQKAVADDEDNEIYYGRAFGSGTGLRYKPTMTGIKEEIVLDTYTGASSWKFVAQTNGLQPYLDSNGVYYFAKSEDSQNKYSLGNVYTYDSAGNYIYGTMSICEITRGELYTVELSVDEAFLTDESTVYPVYVDPQLNIKSSSIEDTTILRGAADSTSSGSSEFIYVGKNSLHDMGRGMMMFTSLQNSALFNYHMDYIESAELKLFVASMPTGGEILDFYQCTNRDWSENTVTWNSVSGGTYNSNYKESLSVTETNKYLSLDVTSFVDLWQENENYLRSGLLIKADDESKSTSYVAFYSSEADSAKSPVLVIKYTTDWNEHFKTTVLLEPGNTVSIDKTGIYEDYVTYTSNNNSIATVSQLGRITGVSLGETTVNIKIVFDTNCNGKVDNSDEVVNLTCNVLVDYDPTTGSSLCGNYYTGTVGMIWERDFTKSKLRPDESIIATFVDKIVYISYFDAISLLAFKQDESVWKKFCKDVVAGISKDLIVKNVKDALISAGLITVSQGRFMKLSIDALYTIVKVGMDWLEQKDVDNFRDCCMSMTSDDYVQVIFQSSQGITYKHYKVYTPVNNVFENPKPDIYCTWTEDTYGEGII